jgi:hypothetical protein
MGDGLSAQTIILKKKILPQKKLALPLQSNQTGMAP